MFEQTRALGLGLGLTLMACGSDDAPPVMETDAGTSGSTSDGTEATPTTTMPDDTTAPGSSGDGGTTTAADSSTSEAESSTGCPAATEGCPCEAGFCDDGLVCSDAGICEPPPACRSIEGEVHDDEGTAISLNELNCDNTLDVGIIGTLEGPQTDWYRFFGDEGAFFCTEQPSATITADVTTDVCVYIECLEGNATDISCGGGSNGADSPEGRPGCCGTDAAVITDYECGGFITPKNTNIWISVGTAELVCADYGVAYGF